jgi:glyoxylase-like metal-dependent hydrolase (beta-lactamase superfamily II)
VEERLAVAPPPPKDIPKPLSTWGLELLSKQAVSGLTMQAFNTGKMLVRGEVISSMKSWHAELELDVPAFLIHHPKQGLILFDTGLSRQAVKGKSFILDLIDPAKPQFSAEKGQDIVAQLAEDDIAPSDVRWVILSTLDREHAGMAAFFDKATIIVSRAEWEWQKARYGKNAPESLALTVIEPRVKLVDIDQRPAYGPFIHCLDYFEDGTIYLVDLAGRTAGTMGALVMLDGGPAMLAGDSAIVVGNYLDLALPLKSQVQDLGLFWRSLHVLRAFRDAVAQAVIIPGHDLRSLALAGRSDIPVFDFRGKKFSAEDVVKPDLRR